MAQKLSSGTGTAEVSTGDATAGMAVGATAESTASGGWLASVQPLFRWQPGFVADGDVAHLPLLYWLACQLRPELSICLGVGDGMGHFAICEAAQTCDFPAQVFGIDLWASSEAHGLAAVPAALADHAAEHHAGRARLICADPDAAADFFDLGNIGLLVVDQPLSADLVARIGTVWMPLMAQTSAIVLRNTGGALTGDVAGDVAEQLDALCVGRPHLMVAAGDGVLVVANGPDLPAPLAGLLGAEAEADSQAEIAGVLRWTGAALADRQRYAAAQARNAALQQDIARYVAQLASRDAAIADLTRRSEAQAAGLAQAEAAGADQRVALRELTARAEALLQDNSRIAQDRDALQAALTQVQAQTAEAQAVQTAEAQTAEAQTAEAQAAEVPAAQEQVAQEQVAQVHLSGAAQQVPRADLVQQLAGRDAALALAAAQAQAKAQSYAELEAVVARQRKELVVLTKMAEQLAKATPQQAAPLDGDAAQGRVAPDDFATHSASAGESSGVPDAKPLQRSRLKSLGFGLRLRGAQSPSLSKQAKALVQSAYFDSTWYAKAYPDCGGPAKAAVHYLREGAFVGNDPGPRFSTTGYYQRNPDVAESDWAALAHYEFYGKAEGRVFDPLAPDEGM